MKRLGFCLLLSACRPPLADSSVQAIYGEDGRREVGGEATFWNQTAASVGIQIAAPLIRCDEATCTVDDLRLGELAKLGGQPLCPQVPYQDQPIPGTCSGFLAPGGQTYITAGHCIIDQADCENMRFVFGYNQSRGEALSQWAKDDVYRCERILQRQFSGKREDPDYAIIRLDRPVRSAAGLEFSRNPDELRVGSPLTMIGHPLGLPAKIARGAQVRALCETYFVANLDAFTVNSGSPVFNSDSGLVEGILVRGEQDFVFDKARGCQALRYCKDEDCRGEDVQRISALPLP